jgi:hypothetical protein
MDFSRFLRDFVRWLQHMLAAQSLQPARVRARPDAPRR